MDSRHRSEAHAEQMIRTLHEGLLVDGFAVPLTKLCSWFDVPRRTVYYKPVKVPPKIDPAFEEPIKAMIEENPSFDYRTVAWLLGFNKNTVQRVFQLKGGRSARGPLAHDHASKRCPRWQGPRMSAPSRPRFATPAG